MSGFFTETFNEYIAVMEADKPPNITLRIQLNQFKV